MALIKGKFIDPSIKIQQNSDPVAGDDLARKSYVDTKSEGDAAAAQSAAEAYADGAASAAQSAAQSYADGKVEDALVDGVTTKAPSQNVVFDALALKQNSLGTGTTSQFLRGDLTWQEIVTTVALAQEVFVAKNGSDASGTGTLDKPFASITAALNSISDASPTKRYVIKVAAGSYTEASVALKANVFIIGESKESVRVTGAVSLHSSFSGSADNRSGFSMITLLSAADFNWQTVTSAAGKLYMNEVVFGSTLNMYGHNNAIAQAQFDSCVIFGAVTISGINVGVFTNNIAYGNITLNQHPNGGMASILAATGGSCSGTVRFNTTVSDFGRRSAGFLKGFNCENLIIDGPSSYADVDLVSQGKSSTQKLNGATLVALNPRVSHDLETQMLKPLANNAHNSGDWGKQWFFNFAYVHASAGTDLYLLSAMENYDPAGDSAGRSILINSDGYGLKPNVSGGNIELETAAVSGTGVRGKVQIKARELDMTSAKITSLADGTASTDAVNKGQLDSAASAAQSAAEAAANAYTDSQIGNLEGNPDVASLVGALATSVSLQLADKLDLAGGTMTGSIEMSANKITGLADGVDPQDAVTKAQLDAAVQAADQSPYKQSKVLDATDISNGYVDLARIALANSMMVSVSGTVQYEDEDYSLSTVGGVTRVTFLGDLTPDGDGAALVVGDKVHFHYWAPVE